MTKSIIITVVVVLACIGIFKFFSNQKATAATMESNTNSEKATIELTKADFLKKVVDYESNPNEWKYLGNKPAIVDFYASWCGPCKMIAPVLEELAKEYKDKIVIYKVNTEKEQELAGAFGIRSIPTLLFIPVSGEPRIIMGAQPKAELKKTIDSFLLNQ